MGKKLNQQLTIFEKKNPRTKNQLSKIFKEYFRTNFSRTKMQINRRFFRIFLRMKRCGFYENFSKTKKPTNIFQGTKA